MQMLYLVLIGMMAGVLSGIFGIGGGIILVPAFVWLCKVPQLTASAMSLVALLLPVGALGVWEYYRAGKLQLEHVSYGLLVALGLFLGTYVGARLALPIPELILRRGFALLLLGVAIRFWVK